MNGGLGGEWSHTTGSLHYHIIITLLGRIHICVHTSGCMARLARHAVSIVCLPRLPAEYISPGKLLASGLYKLGLPAAYWTFPVTITVES